jgi:multimeric flavodoxin WrbA
MKITILNGENKNDAGGFTDYITEISTLLKASHEVVDFTLNEMSLNYCTGCWTCWWKTPGLCVIKDDAEQIFRSVINSDLVIFASPLHAGFTSSTLKKITDRLIVLIHPYVQIRNDENHHQKRYVKYPDIGLILDLEKDTDETDIRIIGDIYDRFAINFHSEKKFLKIKDQHSKEEILDEIINN